MEADSIIFQITDEKGEVSRVEFDRKILNFNIEYLSNNHHQPYPIPNNIAKSIQPFQIMRQFAGTHNYDPSSVKVSKPVRSRNYSEVVDPLTYKVFSKYSDQKFSQEVASVITLSRFLRFHQLTDAMSAAVAVNYFIGDDQKSLEEFVRQNGLEDMSCDEICEIIKLYEDQFRLIEIKAKEEMMKISQAEFMQS